MVSLAHKDDYYETPDWLIHDIIKKTGLDLDLDVCADVSNTKCKRWLTEEFDTLKYDGKIKTTGIFCNPPRSKNGKFVYKMLEIWKEQNTDIVMLLCWNDLGNKYGAEMLENILNCNFEVENLGKIKFYKNGKESKFVSRLTYFWVWMKKK